MELKLLVTLQSDTDTDAKNSRKLIELKMKRLTTKEKEIMELYWQHGPLFVKELLEYYDEPRPHFNTLSTTVRILEKKGFLDHKQFGTSYQKNYFDDSYLSAVSCFVKEEKISVEELKELIEQIENSNS